MLDANTYYLNEYEHSQSILERDWELSKPQKCDDVIEYAKKLMEGLVSKQEFAWVFTRFYVDSDFDGDIFLDGFMQALKAWRDGLDFTNEEVQWLQGIAEDALNGASLILFDVELEELTIEVNGKDNLKQMIDEVVYG